MALVHTLKTWFRSFPPPFSFTEGLFSDLNRVCSITVAHAQGDAIKADVLVLKSSSTKPNHQTKIFRHLNMPSGGRSYLGRRSGKIAGNDSHETRFLRDKIFTAIFDKVCQQNARGNLLSHSLYYDCGQ